MKKIDMSGEAISIRMKQVDQLRYLCISLIKAKKKDNPKKQKSEKKDDRIQTK